MMRTLVLSLTLLGIATMTSGCVTSGMFDSKSSTNTLGKTVAGEKKAEMDRRGGKG